MDGRVKTLHPGVHAGLLARRDSPGHMRTLVEHGLHIIARVCCILCPFIETVGRPVVAYARAMEQIDIGGPAMVRAASKKHASVVVVVGPERYTQILDELHA